METATRRNQLCSTSTSEEDAAEQHAAIDAVLLEAEQRLGLQTMACDRARQRHLPQPTTASTFLAWILDEVQRLLAQAPLSEESFTPVCELAHAHLLYAIRLGTLGVRPMVLSSAPLQPSQEREQLSQVHQWWPGWGANEALEQTLSEPPGGLVTEQQSLLTRREQTVLAHIRTGKSNAEIAQILGITRSTVQNHLSDIFKKLCVHNRTEAVYVAERQRIDVQGEEG